MGKHDLSLYHLNLLHLQMDTVLLAFNFLKEKRNKLDHFVTLTHIKIAKGFVIIFHKFRGQINENFCHCENFVSDKSFAAWCRQKFSIAICINCIGKMLLWAHFCGIMELLFNNYLGHFLIIEKKICFSFHIKCNKYCMLTSKCSGVPNKTNRIGGDLNVSMNQSHQSPLWRVASWSFQSAIYTGPMGGRTSMLGQINLQLMEELRCSKRLTGDCTIMNS